MAADKHSPNRARVRKGGRRQKQHRSTPRQGESQRQPAAQRNQAVRTTRPKALAAHLKDRIRGLSSAMSAVIVSVAALRRQNCEIDEDIASVLERSAADRLDIEIEQLAALSGINRKFRHASHSEGAQS